MATHIGPIADAAQYGKIEIGLPPVEIVGAGKHLKPDLRMRSRKGADNTRRPFPHQCRRQAHFEQALRFISTDCIHRHFFKLCQNARNFLVIALPLFGQNQPRSSAFKQFKPKKRFKILYLAADATLRHPKIFRCAREAQIAYRSIESVQSRKGWKKAAHWIPLNFIMSLSHA